MILHFCLNSNVTSCGRFEVAEECLFSLPSVGHEKSLKIELKLVFLEERGFRVQRLPPPTWACLNRAPSTVTLLGYG